MPHPSTPKAPRLRTGARVVARKLAEDLPNRLDAHVGNRLRVRRMLAGLTQDELAAAVGITFQQVQKYEKGANRISASRLHAFSNVLKVRVGWFFEDVEPSAADGAEEMAQATDLADDIDDTPLSDNDLLGSREALELIGAYWRIRSADKRQALLQLIRQIAG